MKKTYVVVAPSGLYWVGLAEDEQAAWEIALGWPSSDEIADHKKRGWYVTMATLSWGYPGSVTNDLIKLVGMLSGSNMDKLFSACTPGSCAYEILTAVQEQACTIVGRIPPSALGHKGEERE